MLSLKFGHLPDDTTCMHVRTPWRAHLHESETSHHMHYDHLGCRLRTYLDNPVTFVLPVLYMLQHCYLYQHRSALEG